MSAFEEAQQHEDGQEVHVGRVELEVDASGADVVAGRHEPDHNHVQAHCVEQAVVKSHSFVRNLILLSLFTLQELPHPNHFEEENSEDDVANVAEDMVPHGKGANRLHALEIVETAVLIPSVPWANMILKASQTRPRALGMSDPVAVAWTCRRCFRCQC